MKKGFQVWFKTTTIYAKVLPFVMAVLFLIFLIPYIEPVYISYMKKLPWTEDINCLLTGTLFCILFFINMKGVLAEVIKEEFQLGYWLVLSEKEFFVYVLLKRIGWFYGYLVFMSLVTTGRSFNKGIVWILLTLLYLAVAYLLYLAEYSKKGKTQRTASEQSKRKIRYEKIAFFRKHSCAELIFLNWYYRYLSIERMACKTVVTGIALYLATRDISAKILFVIFLILFLVLTFVEDNYWKRESRTADLLKMNGVSFCRYYLVSFAGGILFHIVLLSVLFGAASRNIFYTAIYVLCLLFLLWYWTCVYLYLNMSRIGKKEMAKQLFLTGMLIAEFIPVVNFVTGMYFLRKAVLIWRE